MDAARNLLYGVVALQANLIPSEHMEEFMELCADWRPESGTLMVDLLTERGWVRPEDRVHLDYLVERQMKDRRQDDPVTVTVLTSAIEHTMTRVYRPDPPPLETGETPVARQLALVHSERYRRTTLHATGGIGRVWVARDVQLGRDVALKELLPAHSNNGISRARFLREARITGQLEHPGIVPVYELGYGKDSHEPFYTMRFVNGRTMRDAALAYHEKRAEGKADSLEFLTLLNAFALLCKTVGFAHSRGVVHRDIKGQNVILGDYGEVVVLDWGIAKKLDQQSAPPGNDGHADGPADPQNLELTMFGEAVGTPGYMAPEQAAGRLDLIDERTDVYGLGATLYQLLTGRAPFTGPTPVAILQQVRENAPMPPDQYWPEVPSTLQAACLRALAKQPSDRFSSALELGQRVEQWQDIQRKRAEEELRESQALYSSLVENIPIWVWRKDLDSRFTFVNKGFSDGLGVPASEIIGKTDHDLFSRALADKIRRDDLHVIRSGAILRLTEERAPGEMGPGFIEVIKVPIRDFGGNIIGTQGVLWDLTAWKKAEDAIRESESIYHSLVEGIPISVWRKDAEGRFTFANESFLTLCGKTRTELLGKTDYDLFPADLAEKYRNDDGEVMRTGEALRAVEEHTLSGSRETVEVVKIPIRNSRGHIVGTQGVFWNSRASVGYAADKL